MELTRSERPSLIYQPISAYPFLDKAETAADIQTISSGLSPSLPYFTPITFLEVLPLTLTNQLAEKLTCQATGPLSTFYVFLVLYKYSAR